MEAAMTVNESDDDRARAEELRSLALSWGEMSENLSRSLARLGHVATPLSLYRFYIDDVDPQSIMFGCTAVSLADAERQARASGHKEFTLFEERQLEADEGYLAALDRIEKHPFLGPEWAPLVAVSAKLTAGLKVGRFWSLETYWRKGSEGSGETPYVQAMLEDDGSLHVEVACADVRPPTRPEQYALLELLGWTPPYDAGTPVEDRDTRLPNSYRLFEPGWNAQGVAEVFLEALTMVFGITEDALFYFGESHTETVQSMNLMELAGGPATFALPGRRRPLTDTEEAAAER